MKGMSQKSGADKNHASRLLTKEGSQESHRFLTAFFLLTLTPDYFLSAGVILTARRRPSRTSSTAYSWPAFISESACV